ncbi:MAG TPA: alpha/beta hydrolase-fold protein [Pseudohaliea sp.]|nr:alpha/beta hydrolase-fold protein [Pseudohaliea sp.]
MNAVLELLVYMTILTFVAIMLGAFLRNREWTAAGLQAALGNRDQLPEPTALGGRAQRAAANSIEALLLFTPIALVASAAGMTSQVLLGAQVFFWARVAYLPIYLAGITYIRSLVWGVGVFGLAMMVVALLWPPLVNADVSTSELPVLSGTEIHRVDASAVGDSFVVYVRMPQGALADPDRRYPVVYGLDGDHTFPQLTAITTQLGWGGSLPEVITVGIGYGTLDLDKGNHRMRDLSPQGSSDFPESGGGPKFLEFMAEQLFPLIESQYPADPERRYLFGHSLGGLFSLYAYAQAPELFAGIAAGSPYLQGQLDFLFSIDDGDTPRATNLFIATGDRENPDMFIDDLDQLRGQLASDWATTGSTEIVLLPGFDHYTAITPAMSRGLQAIFNGKR